MYNQVSSQDPTLIHPHGPPQLQRRRFTTQDWATHRRLITKKYTGDHVGLKTIRNFMETRYGLLASEKMYKDQLKAWSVTKNLRKEEVEALIRVTIFHDGAGKPINIFRWAKPVTKAKLHRYLNDHPLLKARLRSEVLDEQHIDVLIERFLPQRGFCVLAARPSRVLRDEEGSHLTHASLYALKTFEYRGSRWNFKRFPSSLWMIHSAVFGKGAVGSMAERKRDVDWRTIQKACQKMYDDIIEKPDELFFHYLFLLSNHTFSTGHAALACDLAEYTGGLFASCLGSQHPYSIIFASISKVIQQEAYEGFRSRIYTFVIDTILAAAPCNGSPKSQSFCDIYDHILSRRESLDLDAYGIPSYSAMSESGVNEVLVTHPDPRGPSVLAIRVVRGAAISVTDYSACCLSAHETMKSPTSMLCSYCVQFLRHSTLDRYLAMSPESSPGTPTPCLPLVSMNLIPLVWAALNLPQVRDEAKAKRPN